MIMVKDSTETKTKKQYELWTPQFDKNKQILSVDFNKTLILNEWDLAA